MRSTLVAGALAASAVALPAATLQAFDNSCIISGSTDRTCASESWASGLPEFESRILTAGYGDPTDPFESRITTRGFGDPLEDFRSDTPSPFVIILR